MIKENFSDSLNRKTSEFLTLWLDQCVQNTDSNIVQIGSNDGVTGDPIYDLIMKKTNWNVLLVEPIPYLFEKLKSNYPKDPRFSFDQVAVNDGTQQLFYSVHQNANKELDNLPEWYDQLGSFNKSHILKHLDGILEPYIEETEISGITLNQLFERNNINDLSLLHVDTEGYDWKVLSQLDLKTHQPIIILFEYEHLQEEEIVEAVFFFDADYHVIQVNRDILCIRRDSLAKRELNGMRERLINID